MTSTKKGLALLVGLVLATGCLERKERLRVRADGSVEVVHVLKGDAGEFDASRGDALPTGAPWTVTDRDVPRDDGKGVDHVREARATFARVEDLPRTFGDEGDPAPLAQRSSLAVERRPDGVVRWTFERRYAPRADAWRERLWKKHFPDALRKELEAASSEARGAPLPEPLLRRACEALIAFERDKTLGFLEQALGEASVAARLAARESYGRAFDAAWRVDDLLATFRSPELREKLDARYRAETARDAARAAALALAPDDAARRAELEATVAKAFVRARRVLEVTEALKLHSFEVRVELPAPVVGSDAETVEDGGRTAVFRFKGEDLLDREHVLRAVAEARP